jgi:hypothetical protein
VRRLCAEHAGGAARARVGRTLIGFLRSERFNVHADSERLAALADNPV